MTQTARLLAAAILLGALTLHAQQIADPANLTGEHVSPQSPADTLPINHGGPALAQLLLKLRTRASMMLIVAHPDDEDGGFLTYESRGQGARVAMLTLTRGEGGQNLMSADFDDALGLIRTQELLAADRYMGVDQFFGTEVDFGFSKTKEETLAKWTHERVLYDAVRCIRLYRPLVIASVFVGGPTDGHGHHQVAGEIAQEAFVAAADPKIFPEMIRQGLLPWAALKVYARTPFFRVSKEGMYDYATGKYAPPVFHNYVTGLDTDHEPSATVMIHESEPGNRPGMDGDTYVQFARRGLALQKSQNGGIGRGGPNGGTTVDVGYTLIASRVGCAGDERSLCPPATHPATEQTVFDGFDTSLSAVAGLAPDAPLALHQALTQTLADLDGLFTSAASSVPDHLEGAVDPLNSALFSLDKLLAEVQTTTFDPAEKFNLQHELRVKRTQLVRALTLALGITSDSVVNPSAPAALTPGKPFVARATLTTSSPTPLTLLSATLHIASANGDASPTIVQAQPLATPTLLSAGQPLTLMFEDRLPANTPVTRPAFSRMGIEQPYYDVPDAALADAPSAPAPLIARLILRDAAGAVVEIESAVHTRVEVPNAVAQLALIVPAFSVEVSPGIQILPAATKSFTVQEHVIPFMPSQRTGVEVPSGWTVRPHAEADPASKTTVSSDLIELKIPPTKPVTLHASASATDGRKYAESYRPVGYPGLTYTNLYKPATTRVIPVDVTTAPNLRIAYLPGTGDPVAEFLPNLGVTPTLIAAKDLNPESLSRFDAVLLGVRAYAAQSALGGRGSQPLLDYAKNGGVVIVQYMTAKYGDAEAPYPITVPGDSAHNVVVEAQPVTILAPDAPLLSWPNKITAADFHNWVAEYGHGFASSWAPQYEPLLEVHDPDQDPQKGGLLLAPVGKGAYIYCALALYRQLPEGVPGAYRLFANLLSYAKNPHR